MPFFAVWYCLQRHTFVITTLKQLHTCAADDVSNFPSKQNLIVYWLDFICVCYAKVVPAGFLGYTEDHHREVIESGSWCCDLLAVIKENDCGAFESTVSRQNLPIYVLVSSDPNRTAAGPLHTLHYVITQAFSQRLVTLSLLSAKRSSHRQHKCRRLSLLGKLITA